MDCRRQRWRVQYATTCAARSNCRHGISVTLLISARMYVYTCVRVCARVCMFAHVCARVCIFTRVCVCVYVCMRVCVCMFAHVRVRVRVRVRAGAEHIRARDGCVSMFAAIAPRGPSYPSFLSNVPGWHEQDFAGLQVNIDWRCFRVEWVLCHVDFCQVRR